LSIGVAERLVDEPAHFAGEVVLRAEPLEELAHKRCEHGFALLKSRGGRQVAPGLVELVKVANAQEPFASDGEAGDRSFPKTPPDVTPTGDLGRCVALVVDGIAAEQRVVDGVSIGLDVAGEAAEHFADDGAGVLGLKLEEDVLLVGQNDEEMALSAGLPPAVRKWLRSDRDSGGVGRETESVFSGVVGASQHDSAEARADFLGGAGHGATVERDAVGFELLFLPKERHAEAKLLDDDASEHARRKQPAADEQRGQRRGHDGEPRPVLLEHGGVVGQRLRLGRGHLVLGAREHDAHLLGPLVTELVAQLPVDEGSAASFKLEVTKLDTALRQVVRLGQISAAFGGRFGLGGRLAGGPRTRAGVGVRARFAVQLPGKRVELLLGRRELKLKLRRVHALGFGDKDTTAQKLELLHQLPVRTAQVVALTDDASEPIAGDREFIASCRESIASCHELAPHASNESFELLHARLGRV